jgi:hypothetical protein
MKYTIGIELDRTEGNIIEENGIRFLFQIALLHFSIILTNGQIEFSGNWIQLNKFLAWEQSNISFYPKSYAFPFLSPPFLSLYLSIGHLYLIVAKINFSSC